MIRKLMISLLGIALARILLVLVAINLTNTLVFDRLEPSFDLSLLDQIPQTRTVIDILTVLIAVFIFLGMFSKSTKKKLDDDKKNFTHLSSIHEAKRSLTRVQFHEADKGKSTKEDIRWVLNETSFLTKADRILNYPKLPYNALLTFFRIDDWHKLNTVRHWEIDGKPVTQRAGLPIYMPRFRKQTIFVDANDNHSILIGTTNSGKTFSVILQMIELVCMSGECAVINDPKGELYEYTAKQFEEAGYEIIKLNLVNAKASDAWAPLELAWDTWKKAYMDHQEALKKWKAEETTFTPAEKAEWLDRLPEPDYSQAIEFLKDLANSLTYDPNVKDPFWNDSARDCIIGMAAFLMEEAVRNGDMTDGIINFKAIKLGLNYADVKLTKEQQKALQVRSDNILGAVLEKSRRLDDTSHMYLMDYCNAPEQTRQSIKKVLATKIDILTMNEQIMRMTSYSDFDMKALGQKKMVIYLIVHDEKKTYYPLVTIFLKQLYEVIINEARGNKGRLPIPVNVILDEFGNCPPLKDIQSMLTASRSRGVRFSLVVQDLSQLGEVYGDKVATTIQNNCSNTVYILGSQMDTLKRFSEMCGSRQIWLPSKSWYETRPVISIDRLQKLNLGEVVIHRQRKSPFIARMIPYDRCKFYRGKNMDPNEERSPKPAVRWIDMKALLSNYGDVF